MITSGYSKSSNFSEFNPILQKYYEMICEIIVSTTICGMFLIYCPLSFVNNFMVKNNFSEPQNHQKLNISRPIYFKKYSYLKNPKKDLAQINWKDLFFRKKNFFLKDLEVFSRLQNPNCHAFLHKIYFFIYFILFLQGWLFDFNIILKSWFKILFRKTVKNGDFYSFK